MEATEGTQVLDKDIYKGEDTGNCWRVKEEDTGGHRRSSDIRGENARDNRRSQEN